MSRSARTILRQAGKRVTPQRLLILETIREGEGHLDADEIHRLAKRKSPRLSLSTVYRTINLLKEAGVIEEVHLGEEHHHYELRDEKGHHHHLICKGCGKVIEFDCPFDRELLDELSRQHGFQITRVHLDLLGYCAQCRSGKKPG